MNVSIVHISDTHGRHADLVLPSAQMLIHTGDFCEDGTDAEWESFNLWLGEIKPNYRWIFVIMGNHDYKFLDGLAASDELIETLASDETRRAFLQARLSNAVVLDNEQLEVPVGEHSELRLKLFASAWSPWQSSPTHVDKVALPGGRAVTDHDRVFEAWSSKLAPGRKAAWTPGEAFRYDELPPGIDILLTHVAPLGVLDRMPELADAAAIGALVEGDVRIVLFVVLAPSADLDADLAQAIRRRLRSEASPRHVPKDIFQIPAIPKTRTGKTAELALRTWIEGGAIRNRNALVNAEVFDTKPPALSP